MPESRGAMKRLKDHKHKNLELNGFFLKLFFSPRWTSWFFAFFERSQLCSLKQYTWKNIYCKISQWYNITMLKNCKKKEKKKKKIFLWWQNWLVFFEFHKHSETILISQFGAKDTFLIISYVKNSCATLYFCGNRDTFFFHDSLIKFKRTAFIWHKNLLHIINVFTATFDQFNVSMQNKNVLPPSHNVISNL